MIWKHHLELRLVPRQTWDAIGQTKHLLFYDDDGDLLYDFHGWNNIGLEAFDIKSVKKMVFKVSVAIFFGQKQEFTVKLFQQLRTLIFEKSFVDKVLYSLYLFSDEFSKGFLKFGIEKCIKEWVPNHIAHSKTCNEKIPSL